MNEMSRPAQKSHISQPLIPWSGVRELICPPKMFLPKWNVISRSQQKCNLFQSTTLIGWGENWGQFSKNYFNQKVNQVLRSA